MHVMNIIISSRIRKGLHTQSFDCHLQTSFVTLECVCVLCVHAWLGVGRKVSVQHSVYLLTSRTVSVPAEGSLLPC